MPPSFPLDGLKVIDFSHALAGPYCTMLMAAYGADVVKVEGIEPGDIGRTWGPPFIGPEGSFFLGLNSGKQAFAVDLKHPEGIDLCRRLVEGADIVIENFRPGTMERLGLGYAAAAAVNPRLIYCSISGYGQTGPRRDDPAMDLILQAASGLISVTGSADGATVRCGHSVADVTAGMFGLIGILMALRTRSETGRGQQVDISMLDGMISVMASNFANLFGSGRVPGPMGTAFATIVPYACFPTADRDIAIAVASDKLWRSFCEVMERPDIAADPGFATNALRVEHRGVLESMITDIFRTRTAPEWLAALASRGVPCAPVNSLADVAADPQAAARSMFPVIDHPTAGPIRITGAPIKFSESTGEIRSPAPRLGEHARTILRDRLGVAPADIERLIAAGVVADGMADRHAP